MPGADVPESDRPGVMVQDVLADERSGAVVAPLTTGQDALPLGPPRRRVPPSTTHTSAGFHSS